MEPSSFDLWFNAYLSSFIGKSRAFDLAVLGGVEHFILGGFWYGAFLFLHWIRGNQAGNERSQGIILRIFLATMISILLMLGAAMLISHAPPASNPKLAGGYPPDMFSGGITNSFPSYSTTLYTTIAVGSYALDRAAALFLGVGIVILIGLPRIYLGGHYPSDVIAGMVLGIASHFLARLYPEPRLRNLRKIVFGKGKWPWVIGQVIVYGWLLQIFDEFREAKWLAGRTSTILMIVSSIWR